MISAVTRASDRKWISSSETPFKLIDRVHGITTSISQCCISTCMGMRNRNVNVLNHGLLMELFEKTYAKRDYGGICLGYSQAGKKAALSSKLEQFNAMLTQLNTFFKEPPDNDVNILLARDLEFVQFFKDMSLAYPDLCKPEEAQAFKMAEKKALVGRSIGFFSTEEQLQEYFAQLETFIKVQGMQIPTVVRISNQIFPGRFSHIVMISYNFATGLWDFSDVSTDFCDVKDTYIRTGRDIKEISALVFLAFDQGNYTDPIYNKASDEYTLRDENTILDFLCQGFSSKTSARPFTFEVSCKLDEEAACSSLANAFKEWKSGLIGQNPNFVSEKEALKWLWIAICSGETDTIKKIGNSSSYRPLINRPVQDTPPLLFAIIRGDIAIIRVLIECGADVNQFCKDGGTPLFAAIMLRNIEIVRILKEGGAVASQPYENGDMPLLYAVSEGNSSSS